jgi:hypothetical protein
MTGLERVSFRDQPHVPESITHVGSGLEGQVSDTMVGEEVCRPPVDVGGSTKVDACSRPVGREQDEDHVPEAHSSITT